MKEKERYLKNAHCLLSVVFFLAAGSVVHAQIGTVPLNKAVKQAADDIIKKMDTAISEIEKSGAAKNTYSKAVAVVSFKSEYPALSKYALSELTNALVSSNKLEVVERARLDALLSENRIFGLEPFVTFVITGDIMHDGTAWRLNVYVIDLRRKTRIASASRNIKTDDPHIAYLRGGRR
jgi:curli biogenesis system outer membrane secretion channel CsgG